MMVKGANQPAHNKTVQGHSEDTNIFTKVALKLF